MVGSADADLDDLSSRITTSNTSDNNDSIARYSNNSLDSNLSSSELSRSKVSRNRPRSGFSSSIIYRKTESYSIVYIRIIIPLLFRTF
jgi:hypothetical protein